MLSVRSCIDDEGVCCQLMVESANDVGFWIGGVGCWTWVVTWIVDINGFSAKKLGLLRSSRVGP